MKIHTHQRKQLGMDAGNVYHYHMSDKPPYTVGCFGPVASVSACKKLSDRCSSDAAITVSVRECGALSGCGHHGECA